METENWEVSSKSTASTTFKFYFKNRYKGDDETAMFELLHSLPSEVTLKDIEIDWENSQI